MDLSFSFFFIKFSLLKTLDFQIGIRRVLATATVTTSVINNSMALLVTYTVKNIIVNTPINCINYQYGILIVFFFRATTDSSLLVLKVWRLNCDLRTITFDHRTTVTSILFTQSEKYNIDNICSTIIICILRVSPALAESCASGVHCPCTVPEY